MERSLRAGKALPEVMGPERVRHAVTAQVEGVGGVLAGAKQVGLAVHPGRELNVARPGCQLGITLQAGKQAGQH